MKAFFKSHVKFVVQCGILLILVTSLIVLSILKNNSDICEGWTRGLGKFHNQLFGYFFDWLPFSITEIVMILTIIGIIILLVLMIIDFIKKRPWSAINKIMIITITIFGIITTYYATFEMAYNRKPLEIDLYEQEVPEDKYYQIVEYYVDDLNECIEQLEFKENGELIKPYNDQKLNDKIKSAYLIIDNDYFHEYTTRVKPMMTSFIYSMFGITGWYFAPTGEAVVNINTTNGEKPLCFAHEIAHSKGVAGEDGAQMVASFVTLSSHDPYLRYSGYINVFWSILAMARYSGNQDAYKTLRNKINPLFIQNYNYIVKYWQDKAIMNKIGDAINDWYLKISGAKDGTTSYQDSEPVISPGGKVISLSRYQKLAVQIYKNNFPNELV